MRPTPERIKIAKHCMEYVFLYHLSDDRGKFSMSAIRSMYMGGLLDKNRGGVDHDETCYELSHMGYMWAKLYCADEYGKITEKPF